MQSFSTYYTTTEDLLSFISHENIQDSSSLLLQIFSHNSNKDFLETLLIDLKKLLPTTIIVNKTSDAKSIDKNIVLNFTQFENSSKLMHKDDEHYLSKERMELALIGSTDGVWDWDILENALYFSPRWKEMLGYKDEELNNELSTWESRVHPEDIKAVWADVQKNIDKETEYYENIHRLKHKEGHWVWILDRGKVQFCEEGKAVRMIGTHTDISKEKEDQFKLSQQAQIIEQMHDSVIATDFNGNITLWNGASTYLLGYQSNDMIGKHIKEIYLEEDYKSLEENIKILREKGSHRAIIRLVKKSKEILYADLSLALLKDEKGKPIGMIGDFQDITERKKAEDALIVQKNILYHQAHYDLLTELPNRTLFIKTLRESMQIAKKDNTGLILFFIDLDKFKNINDSLGHDIGDRVLQIVAKRLSSVIRKEDTLARLSGDEFTIIMDNVIQKKHASSLAKKILKTLFEPIYIDNDILYVTVSMGIAIYPEDAEDAKYLLKYADTAMYKAKEEGRNNYQFYSSDMTIMALEHMKMKTALRQAIDNNEFVLYYQPQINVHTNAMVGIEALVRWQHPSMGLLTPCTFIPLAEETGMIVKIDQWVMKTALKHMARYYEEGLNPGMLAVNISIKQLESPDFIDKLQEQIEKYNFNAKYLELEITENQMMKKPEEIIRKLTEINNLGISISIDDFGTGYSSLSLLKRLPINRLKIDRSFIENIPGDEEDIAIVQAIIALAKSLKLKLIAEGVESKNQKDFLIENGCDVIQGHYFSKALSEKEMRKMLIKNKR